MKRIVVIGEIVVEIMADEPGLGFREPIGLTGPFASGAPAIFADQAARLGQPVALVSTVGDDDFGRLCVERLARDGVDISAIRIDPDRPTGTAFVRYRQDGARDFVFNIKHSAAGRIASAEENAKVVEQADHIHVMGSSLSSDALVALNLKVAASIKSRGGTVSFDPNLRKEMLNAPGMADAMARILALSDLYLPSGEELTLFTKADDETLAIAELLDAGIVAIVHKKGAEGASYYDKACSYHSKAFLVDEIDPTGAGDCFGGTFTSLWLRNLDAKEALRLASASGALAVTRRGPMEGAASMAALNSFIDSV